MQTIYFQQIRLMRTPGSTKQHIYSAFLPPPPPPPPPPPSPLCACTALGLVVIWSVGSRFRAVGSQVMWICELLG